MMKNGIALIFCCQQCLLPWIVKTVSASDNQIIWIKLYTIGLFNYDSIILSQKNHLISFNIFIIGKGKEVNEGVSSVEPKRLH